MATHQQWSQFQTQQWNQMALEHGQKNKTWFQISRDSPERGVWGAYFQRLGWEPWAFKRLRMEGAPTAVWTAPCKLPEWLPDFEEWKAARRAA